MISSFKYGLAKNSVIQMKTDQIIVTSAPLRNPSTIRLYCLAPKFCDVKVVIVALIDPTGSSDEELIYQASLYLKISSAFYPVLSVLVTLRNALQGLGQKMMPLVSSIIEMLGKILFVIFIIPSAGYLGVIFVEPILWVVMAAQLYYAFRKEPVIRSLKKKSE